MIIPKDFRKPSKVLFKGSLGLLMLKGLANKRLANPATLKKVHAGENNLLKRTLYKNGSKRPAFL